MNTITNDSMPLISSEIIAKMLEMSKVMHELQKHVHIKKRPILGGLFGYSGYALCSCPTTISGLDAVVYFVRESDSGFVIGSASTRGESIEQARKVLGFLNPLALRLSISEFKKHCIDVKLKSDAATKEQAETINGMLKPNRPKSIPKRRMKIYEASNGMCHYCGTALVLTGRWHIDHKMPKALMGDDSPANLVASCTSCNHKKRDTTDQEFIAKLRAA